MMKNNSKVPQLIQRKNIGFFSKPIETITESVITYDDPMGRQMGFEERVRHEMTFYYNN